jgi:S-adenosylmethionine uptake transporter
MRLAAPMLFAFVGIALLCAMEAAIKGATASDPVVTVTVMRYAFGTLFALPLFALGAKTRPTWEVVRGHALRGVVIAAAAYLFYYALSVLPIAEAITIAFVAPLIVPPAARLLLGERMRAASLAACVVGFLGVLVTLRGSDLGHASPDRMLGVAAALVSAALYALSVVLLRQRAVKDDPWTIGFLAALFPALATAPFALAAGSLPSLGALPQYALIGALGTGGMLMLALAYARAEAQKLIVLEYTALGWAAIYGYWFFGERLRVEVVLGAAIIAGACMMSAFAGRKPALAE